MQRLITRILIGTRPRKTLIRAGILAICCYFFFRYPFQPVLVHGTSMEPTYRDGALRFSNSLSYLRDRHPTPGDVVVIRMAGRRTMYLKRILAIPGDEVYFDKGILWINGETQSEPYVVHTGTWTTRPVLLESQEYFVAGDNRAMPRENHVMGIVDRNRIEGKLWN